MGFPIDWANVVAGVALTVFVGWTLKVFGISIEGFWHYVTYRFSKRLRSHLGRFDLFRINSNGKVTKASILIRTGVRGLGFIYTPEHQTESPASGRAYFCANYLVLCIDRKPEPYLAVFWAYGEGLENWKAGVFAGVRLADPVPYAGRALLCREGCSMTPDQALDILNSDDVLYVSAEDRDKFVHEMRLYCSGLSG